MEEKKLLSKRDLEILDILGYKEDGLSLFEFLVNITDKESPESLHNKGIALLSIKRIIRKINPKYKEPKKKVSEHYFDEDIDSMISSVGSLE